MDVKSFEQNSRILNKNRFYNLHHSYPPSPPPPPPLFLTYQNSLYIVNGPVNVISSDPACKTECNA